MTLYTLSQIFVVIATIFMGLSYVSKNKKTVMLLCIIYCIFYGTHYLLLGAMTGAGMTLISCFRNIYFYINAKKESVNGLGSLYLFLFIELIIGSIFYQDIYSSISIIAAMLSTYSIWQDNIAKYRLLAVPISLCFITYGIHVNSILSIIIECILLFMELVGIIEWFYKKNKNSLDYIKNIE